MTDSPMCPSAPPETALLLLGRFTTEGRLAFAAQPLPVTEEFLAIAGIGGDVGKRFRFAGPCLKNGCSRWQDGACAVGAAAARVSADLEPPADLPACVIRSVCRWFEQEGEAACRSCPRVVYDNRPSSSVDAP